eukprot:GHVU01119346.1.p1 GENE.GHVU01119346.1~~GHVU01119346.1.p1  ORF type:complete len:107 (+),score=6.79 GHVU01119346.1:678-998(+)
MTESSVIREELHDDVRICHQRGNEVLCRRVAGTDHHCVTPQCVSQAGSHADKQTPARATVDFSYTRSTRTFPRASVGRSHVRVSFIPFFDCSLPAPSSCRSSDSAG